MRDIILFAELLYMQNSRRLFVSSIWELKFETHSHWKLPKSIGRHCEVTWLISQAELALSLDAVSNLRFSSDALRSW